MRRRCRQLCLGSGHRYGFCESCGRHTHRPPAWRALPLWARLAHKLIWRFAWRAPAHLTTRTEGD